MKYKQKRKYVPKPEFIERMQKLLGKQEAQEFFEISYTSTPNSIRCNTLKISPEKLKTNLEKQGWEISQPFEKFPEVMMIKNKLSPGQLGNTYEHLLGYYYVQEISSMLPMLVLQPKPNEFFLDLCASPGSKTTQAASMMENTGTIIANEKDFKRIFILASNLEKSGVMNTILTQNEGISLCEKIAKKSNLLFDRILVDAPCSGEGTLRKSIKTYEMWNLNMVKKLSALQKQLAQAALQILKPGGEMIYSTCTLSPEENEEVLDYLLENNNIEIQKVSLPLKCRPGICEWESQTYNKEVENACRIYPQDNDTDGFFLAKIKKLNNKDNKEAE